MARKKQQLINYHTGSKQSMPLSSEVQYGELVVRHNAEQPELLIKVADDKFATFVDVEAVAKKVNDSADSLNQTINAVSATVFTDYATKSALESVSGNIKSTLNAVKSALEGADTAIATELSAVSATVVANKETYDEYVEQNDKDIAALGAASAAVKTSVAELSAGTRAEVSRLDGRVDSVFTSAVTVSKEYTNVQLSAVTEDLQGQIDDADSAIAALGAASAAVKTSVTELSAGTRAEVSRLDGAITTAKNDAIEAASAFTLAQIKKVNDTNDGLAERVDALESSASTLSDELAELSGVTEDFSAATHTALTGLSAGTVAEVARLDGRVDSVFTSAVTVSKAYTDKKFTDEFVPVKNAVDALTGNGESSVTSIVDKAIANVVAQAPEAFDTLKEIADWIGNGSGTTAAELVTDIEGLKSADTVISGAVNAVSATVVANKEAYDEYVEQNDKDIAALGAASAAVKTSVSELSGATKAEVSRLDGRVDSSFTSAVTYVDAQVSLVTKSLKDKEDALDTRIDALEAISGATTTAIQTATFAEGNAAKSGVEITKSGTTLVFDFSKLIIDCGEF